MSFTSTAVDTYLRVIRVPADLVAGRIGGEAAELALDRFDASARSVAGTLLGDRTLLDDARRRHVAADERERALRLRGEAERVEEEGRQRAGRQRAAAGRQKRRRVDEVDSRTKRERLAAVEEKAEALDRKEDALGARDEAQRLGRSAARVKEQRKRR